MDNNEVNVDELLKRILEEEEYVKSQTLSYDEYLPEFFARAREDLEIIESSAIELENNSDNNDVINTMFRSFHNIKGSSGFVAQGNIQNIAHQTETLLDDCRKGLKKADKHIIDLILRSADLIKQLCDNTELNIDESFLEQVFYHIHLLDEADKQRTPEIQPNEDFIDEIEIYMQDAQKELDLLTCNNNNSEALQHLFKSFHSIKGLSGFAQQKIPQRIAHEAERLLNKNRDALDQHSIAVLSNSIALLREFCTNESLSQDREFLEKICLNIQQIDYQLNFYEILNPPEVSEKDQFLEDFVLETSEHLQNIEANVIELENNKNNQEIINSILRSFHTIKGLSGFASQHLVGKIAHKAESVLQSSNSSIIGNTINLILSSVDYIKKICNNRELTEDNNFLSQIHILLQALEGAENDKNKQILTEITTLDSSASPQNDVVDKPPQNDVIRPPEHTLPQPEHTPGQKKPIAEDYMRIATSKVDVLVEMVGELVITLSLGDLNRMVRITKDLQNIAMFLRLVPLKSTFQKITRVARDTINELGKEIAFSTSGDETEIDRIVTEKLLDPLVHLVKNAISHGIESKGTVQVSAYNKRGSIYIEVIDDGQGINIDRVYQKALEKGLIDAGKDYSEQEIQEFIMLPGFSTVEVANSISGRGVGMDVVRTEIQKIGGKVEIESKKGTGTKFTLKIPLNHAIMNGLIVDIEGTKYILPTINVKQIIQPKEEDWIFTQGVCTQIKVREKIIPVIHIKRFFGQKTEEKPALIVIIEMDQRYTALPVRSVLNRQEVVIKPVGEEFSGLDFVSGMSILGDGRVSLILDVESMFSKQKGVN